MPHFDPRYNRSSGKSMPEPFHKERGAALVAKVMTRQEPKGRSKHQQDDDRFAGNSKPGNDGVIFRIEDGNHAKRIDHDKAPE